MNDNQLHRLEYALHLLDDEDLRGCFLFLSRPRERRRHLPFTVRLMFEATIGMAAVSIASLVLMTYRIPVAVYFVPFYAVYAVLILLAKAYRSTAKQV